MVVDFKHAKHNSVNGVEGRGSKRESKVEVPQKRVVLRISCGLFGVTMRFDMCVYFIFLFQLFITLLEFANVKTTLAVFHTLQAYFWTILTHLLRKLATHMCYRDEMSIHSFLVA